MANTRTAAKRARQTLRRQNQNQATRSVTKTAVRFAVDAIRNQKDANLAKDAYMKAVKALSKAASKGAIPRGRAARKISRLTLLAKKVAPSVVQTAK